jgi:hypothetical protein
MKRIALAALLIALSTTVFAEDLVFDRNPNSFGPMVSSFFTAGAGYTRWFDKVGTGLCASYSYTMDSANNVLIYNYGMIAQGMYRLWGSDFSEWLSSQLYVFGQGILLRENYPSSGLNLPSGIPYLGAAAGFGIEAVVCLNFSFVFEGGYSAVFKNYTELYQTPFIFQGAARFRF